jgi:hypothetical protein
MTPLERLRAALEGYGPLREVAEPGGLGFEWDGDLLARVVDDEVLVRSATGWTAVTGDLLAAVDDAARVVVDECVARWHEQLASEGSARAMLALTHHEPDRAALQRLLLDHTRSTDRNLRHLAVTCLGHVGRLDRQVLPEVVPHLTALLDDPELAGTADDALNDIGIHLHPVRLWRRVGPWVVIAPPGDEEIARQLARTEACGGVVRRVGAGWTGSVPADGEENLVVVVEHAEALPSLPELVHGLCDEGRERAVHFVLEHDGDIGALQALLRHEDYTVVHEPPHLVVH